MYVVRLIVLVILWGLGATVAWSADRPPSRVTELAYESVVPATRSYPGIVHFARVSNVSSELAGVIDSFDERAGAWVSSDKMLATINTNLIQQN